MLKEKYALTDEGVRNIRWGTFWTVVANLVVMSGMGLFFAFANELVETLTNGAPLPDPAFYLVGLVAFAVVLWVAHWFQYDHTYGKTYRESGRQRIALAERLRTLPLAFFGRRDLADLTETIMTDATTMEHVYSHVLPYLYGSLASTGLVAVCLFVFDWRLALASMWTVPVAFAVIFASRRFTAPLQRKTRAASVRVSEGVQETLECVREIRATNQQSAYLAEMSQLIDAHEREMIRGEVVNGLFVQSAQAVLRLGIATTVLVGAALVAQGAVGFFVLFGFLLVVSRIYAPFDQSFMMLSELFMAREVAAPRMRSFYAEPAATGAKEFAPRGHDIVFENVSFAYNAPRAQASGASGVPGAPGASSVARVGEKGLAASAKPEAGKGAAGGQASGPGATCAESASGEGGGLVLRNVSFTAREGEVTALVGPSGSGKSTATRLAARFWDATSGVVSVGGVDVATVDPEVLLRDFSVVFQDVLLFDDTVMGNIRLGRRDATDEEVLAAARAANCDEFVNRLPQGYLTPIGENGSKLSGGERQRISIARALLKGAPVVLLDEATASLDVENESQVQLALSRLLAGKTVLVIAHRMRTVMSTDKIVVLDEGRVVEQGSPADLLEANGLFARMVRLQSESAAWAL